MSQYGPIENGIFDLAKALSEQGVGDEHTRALTALARTTAASLDRLNKDAKRNESTIASVAKVHLDILAELAMPIHEHDPFDELTLALSAAVRDTTQT